ncbi:P-loop NTPase fold protein [Ruegeria sp. HKCCA5426]|uniref:P-loop NTPase fold protein n=1 Tax=Ruegeria sp. HKCCA5426 TaxID=2682985 RepID=UPI001489E3C5|nr:P-loop NTPase fold protein [Ruegeria sp. HKCCA5426]
MAKELDSDRAVEANDDDEFGFVGIAEKLAPRIAEASKSDGMVIGLEGRWGSGKTSLVNDEQSPLHRRPARLQRRIPGLPWGRLPDQSIGSATRFWIAPAVFEYSEFLAE